jgi:hypothetical protein
VNDQLDKQADGNNDDDLLAEVRRYLELCEKADGENRQKALDDLRFLSGDQWPQRQRALRESTGRPVLTINKLPTFLHQVTNEQRLNVPGIKTHPINDASEDDSQVLQGAIRAIEYRSNASVAYNRASNSAAAIGFGYWRLVVDYESPKSFNQEIRFKSIRNPFTVSFDPLSEEPDGSDQGRCLISTKMPRDEFKRQYPKATVTQEALPNERLLNWLSELEVRVGEYYRIEHTTETLVQLPDGTAEWADVLDKQGVMWKDEDGKPLTQTRESDRQRVMLYKLTALEVLERTEILCDWIPVFPVWGDEIDIDGKVVRSGLIRHARDPATMYNYWMTAATEEVAMRTKTPYIGAEGQFEGYEEDWETANTVSKPYLEYKPVTIDGNLAPAPQRQPMADIPAGILQMAMHANDNIKATTGLFDSSLGARGNATSGVQERAQQQQGSLANFHYADSLRATVKQCGRCLASMLPNYYDATRIIAIMGEDESMRAAKINPPLDPQTGKPAIDPTTGKPHEGVDLTKLQAEVTVTAGPSYTTMRQEAVDSMVEVGGKWPKLLDVAGDLFVKNMDWPGASEIADRIKRTMPPAVTGETEGDDMIPTPQGPVPVAQAPQLIAQLMQQLQQCQQMLEKSGLTKAQIDAATKLQINENDNAAMVQVETLKNERAAADSQVRSQAITDAAQIAAEAKRDVAELTGLVQLLVAKLQPPPALAADVAADLAEDDTPAG